MDDVGSGGGGCGPRGGGGRGRGFVDESADELDETLDSSFVDEAGGVEVVEGEDVTDASGGGCLRGPGDKMAEGGDAEAEAAAMTDGDGPGGGWRLAEGAAGGGGRSIGSSPVGDDGRSASDWEVSLSSFCAGKDGTRRCGIPAGAAGNAKDARCRILAASRVAS